MPARRLAYLRGRPGPLPVRPSPPAAETTSRARRGSGSSSSRPRPRRRSRSVSSPTSAASTTARSTSSPTKGLERAKSELKVEGRVLTSTKNSDYVPNLSTLAQQKLRPGDRRRLPDGRGAWTRSPTKFPDTKFAIIDFPQAGLKGKPTNVRGLLFKEAGGGLPRRHAGRAVRQGQGRRAGHLLRRRPEDPAGRRTTSPAIQAGAKKVNPNIKTLNGYSQDFVKQDLCKEEALNQIAEGSQVVFQVAGQCGLGALDAAKEKSMQGIGVDADQGYLGAHILTSALKKVDVAVFDTVKRSRTARSRAARTRSSTSRPTASAWARSQRRGHQVRGPGQEGPGADLLGRDHRHPRPRSSSTGDRTRCPGKRSPSSCAGSPSASARWSRTTRSTSS